MARVKKQTAITMEKRLEQALVPDWEQPYKVPENWVWTLGKSIFLPMETQKPLGDLFRYIDIDSIDNKNQIVSDPKILVVSKAPSRASRKISNGDTVFSMVRPYLKNIAYIDESLSDCIASTGFFVCHPTKQLNNRFIYWLMTSEYVVDGLNQYMKGDNSPSIRQSDIENFAYPIPPIAEQQRIVTRIKSLFAKLDEAKEKVQTALDSFETRKAAILHKAFTGELTVKWREKHGVGMESWKTKTSKELFEYVTSGSRGWAQYYSNNGAVFIRMGNLDHRTIELDLTDIQYVQLPDKAEGRRSRIQKDDILISITADVGMVGFMREINYEAYINQHVALARPNKSEYAEFIAWYLVSDVGLKQLQRKQRGATKVGLGLDDIRSLQLHMPSIPEQQEIVCILNDLLAKEQQAKDACTDMQGQIDLIKKSILARAFRGELGTNDSTEKSAVELLKQCLAQQVNEQEQAPKKKRVPVVILSDEVRSQLSSNLERDIFLLLQKNGPSNMREIASISKKNLDVIEALRQLEKKGLIQKQSDGDYGCVR